jgi:hypothetical protein
MKPLHCLSASMRQAAHLPAILGAASYLLVACAKPPAGGQQEAGTSSSAAAAAPAGLLWTEPQFTSMLRDFRRKLPAKSKAIKFEMGGIDAILEVQDPARPGSVDSYSYKVDNQPECVFLHRCVTGPTPVNPRDMQLDAKLEDLLFDWDEVAVERIPALVQEALARTKLEDGMVVQLAIERNLPSRTHALLADLDKRLGKKPAPKTPGEGDVRISLALKGSRHDGWLHADAKGNVLEAGVD